MAIPNSLHAFNTPLFSISLVCKEYSSYTAVKGCTAWALLIESSLASLKP